MSRIASVASLPVMAAGKQSTRGTIIAILAIRRERGMLQASYAIHPSAWKGYSRNFGFTEF
jgi:hypothetical protein